jgi:type IV pilus assembly protein PilC
MSSYSYVAVDPQGTEMRGTLEVPDQSEALRRIREMGLFPTKVCGRSARKPPPTRARRVARPARLALPRFGRGVNRAALAIFTRQLATLLEAGMPLLRGLRTLEEQVENANLKRVIGEMALAIEGGCSLGEAVGMHPKVFNHLFVNMVKAGELSGALETTLRRLAEFMEKARKIKGKVKAAMFYPCAVLFVAAGILVLLMVFIVPRFRQVFDGLLGGRPMPGFTLLVMQISQAVQQHFLLGISFGVVVAVSFLLAIRTTRGRAAWDWFKLSAPVVGPVVRKLAISRFSRTFGTLVSSGVPILQALSIVQETAGNAVVGRVVNTVHDRVKEGDTIAPSLKASGVFPAMVAGMVEVGEQTGALPEMLMKIADTYDDEVDNSVSAMTSLLEPVMILFLAVVVGSIVIAMFLPLIALTNGDPVMPDGRGDL